MATQLVSSSRICAHHGVPVRSSIAAIRPPPVRACHAAMLAARAPGPVTCRASTADREMVPDVASSGDMQLEQPSPSSATELSVEEFLELAEPEQLTGTYTEPPEQLRQWMLRTRCQECGRLWEEDEATMVCTSCKCWVHHRCITPETQAFNLPVPPIAVRGLYGFHPSAPYFHSAPCKVGRARWQATMRGRLTVGTRLSVSTASVRQTESTSALHTAFQAYTILCQHFSKESVEAFLQENYAVLLRKGTRAVAAAAVSWYATFGVVNMVAVDAELWGQGYCRTLLRAFEALLHHSGARMLLLAAPQEEAGKWVQHHGFSVLTDLQRKQLLEVHIDLRCYDQVLLLSRPITTKRLPLPRS